MKDGVAQGAMQDQTQGDTDGVRSIPWDRTGIQRVKTLRESPKSRVYLVFREDTKTLMVEKHLHGRQDLYEKLCRMEHRYLPKLYAVDVGACETVVWEEYIRGNSLAEIQVGERQLSKWLMELCEVVGFLHSHQILHRDIKPSNLLVGEDGHIRLIDFDAAREIREEQDSDTRLLGTRGFAPPEQYGFAQTDQRADIYAIGITWKGLLGGKANQSPYRAILQRCTQLNPSRRYPTTAALALAWRTRTLRRWLTAAAAGLVLAGGLLGWRWQERNRVTISQQGYPEEGLVQAGETGGGQFQYTDGPLLLYAQDSDYIMAQVGELMQYSQRYTMSIDLNRDGKRETLEVSGTYGNSWPEVRLDGNAYPIEGQGEAVFVPGAELLDYGQTMGGLPIHHYMGQEEAYRWEPGAGDCLQVTCLDLDPLTADNGKEILLSLGGESGHTLTMVFTYEPELEMPVAYQGFMWGEGPTRQNEAGSFEVALASSTFMLPYNLYVYSGSDQGIREVMTEDFSQYWERRRPSTP